MTQEDKELLAKDLCARLPYGVVIQTWYGKRINIKCISVNVYTNAVELDIPEDDDAKVFIDNVKPYLFPLSSMTKEQKEFIKNRFCYDWDIDDHPYSLWAYCIEIGDADELIDFFHKNHIDYRGLIEKGLAINATGLNVY